MKKFFSSILLAMVCTMGIQAQEGVPEASRKPLMAMQVLAPWAGTWEMTMEITQDEGATWQAAATSILEFTMRQKGMMLAEIPTDISAPGFHLETFYSYDQYRDVYRTAVVDDTWGIMDIYEGTIEEGKLVSTNLRVGTLFPISETEWRGFRLTMDLSGDEKRMLVIDKTDDMGNSWQPNFRATYRRK